MGIIDLKHIDTTPGSGHWAAPSQPVDDYIAWLKGQDRSDRGVSQYLTVTARSIALHGMAMDYAGPYAEEAKRAITYLAGKVRR